MNSKHFFKEKPIFGLDVGSKSMKVMQIGRDKKRSVLGYGLIEFNESAVKNGIIVDPEHLALKAQKLFEKNIIGHINTRRAAISVPASRTFTRSLHLPPLDDKDLREALNLEAEQYIPMPLEDLYLDHTITSRHASGIDVLAVAAPKTLIDSYVTFSELIGIELIAIETNISSTSRIFVISEQSDDPTILIDFGTVSADITIYDGGVVVSGTVEGGGDNFSNLIEKQLGVDKNEAQIIKTKYGIGFSKKQEQILSAVEPLLEKLVKEVKRMMRYYEERFHNSEEKHKIAQVVTMGGGANMPGLSDYMINALRMPVRMCDPWHGLNFKSIQPPNATEKSTYITAAGLALLDSKEVFK
jgi:type IV pilus assembly protein PilM